MKNCILWLVVLLFAVALVAYAQGKPTSQVDPRIAAANTDFGFRLFKQLVKESGGKNVAMSPASFSLALSMTYNGASGSTATAMTKTLGYSNVTLDQINAGNKVLMQNLANPGEGIVISVANSLWARKGVQFKPGFIKRNRDFYQAEVAALSFASPSAKTRINSWVSDKTHGKITSIVDRIDPSNILFLVNAIYFNGTWTMPFDKQATEDHDFTLADGKVITVPMMFHHGHYEYLQGDGFQFIKLDYGKTRRMSMYVVLPAKSSSLAALYKQLTPGNWSQWIKRSGGRSSVVELSLPRFKMKYETEAKKSLSALGMAVAFDPLKANFTAMCPIPPTPNVFIGNVKHKAVVEVDEVGTVAAAATSVGMVGTAMPGPQPPPIVMVVDHPFFFAIRDNMTQEILFLGSVADPR